MIINTALVINKKFDFPIKSSVLKHSQEYKVLATLRYLFPEKFETMIRGESPDLQDSINCVGIEVTASVRETDMKVSRAFSELCQGEDKKAKKNQNIIKANGYSYISITDDKFIISTTGTSDGEKHFFQESIRRKINKLEQYRLKFNKIGLAIILPEIPTSYAEEHFSEWILEVFNENDNLFDFVYILSHRFCIYYNVQEDVLERYSITSEENKLLSIIARMTAEGELSLNDLEWSIG